MTPETLMIPRYKVIAHYPESRFVLGDILVEENLGATVNPFYQVGMFGRIKSPSIYNPEKWPHLSSLHDKEEKEIWEGDILRDGFDAIHDVRYVSNGFWTVNRKGDMFLASEDSREVIGNIYENPELITNG